jgi:protein subunit release factor A
MPQQMLMHDAERRRRMKDELLRRAGHRVARVPHGASAQQIHAIVAAATVPPPAPAESNKL